MRRTQTKSFERFYYERVGIGEGCGCAELIIGTHDHETRGNGLTVGKRGWIERGFGALLRRIRKS